jgi:hypothetical protein
MRSTVVNKRVEFVNRDSNAAIHIRRYAVLRTRPKELTRANFMGQPLSVKVYKGKLNPHSREPVKNAWEASARGYSFTLYGRETFPLP